MTDTYYHTCGYPILFGTEREGAGTRAAFWDGMHMEGEGAEEITACPNCGEVLLLGDLTPEPIDEWW